MNLFVLSLVIRLLRLLQFAFFARAIMSWFAQGQRSQIYDLLCRLTEPIVLPFRRLIERFDALRYFPIDVAVLLAIIALEFVMRLLYSLF